VPDARGVGVPEDDGEGEGAILALAPTFTEGRISTATVLETLTVTTGGTGLEAFAGGAATGISIGFDPFNVYC